MGAADYYLKVGDIKGESEKKLNPEWIEIESFSFGAVQSGTSSHGSGAGAGKVSFQDFHFTMKMGKATPQLLLQCAIGKHIPKATLEARKAGGKQECFLKVDFSDVLISSYQTGGSGHSDIVPTDQISLNFSKIEFDYFAQKKDGTVTSVGKVGYDIKKNAKV
ncbi:MAG: Hcp family type VI secretion system effector [Pyrinomonadaceae bacterium]